MRQKMTKKLLGFILLIQNYYLLRIKYQLFLDDTDPMAETRHLFLSTPSESFPDGIEKDEDTFIAIMEFNANELLSRYFRELHKYTLKETTPPTKCRARGPSECPKKNYTKGRSKTPGWARFGDGLPQ